MALSESATIRKLPSGGMQTGSVSGSDGNRVEVRLDADSESADLRAADLIEITSPHTIYLGEVLYRRGEVLTVGVEHVVDRAALATIQQVWRRPERE